MDADRFHALLNGPLNHPLPMFSITRLARALWFIVDELGEPAEKLLEEFCREQEEHDDGSDDVDAGDGEYFAGDDPSPPLWRPGDPI